MNMFKRKIVVSTISIFFFMVMLGLMISLNTIDKYTEDTTTLYTATIDIVEITDTGRNIYCKIHVSEYDTSLQISTNISKNIEIDKLKGLEKGQIIFFRIDTDKTEQMNNVAFVDIVSLRTDDIELFSLDEYNSYIYDEAKPARILGFMLMLVSLIIFIMCILRAIIIIRGR